MNTKKNSVGSPCYHDRAVSSNGRLDAAGIVPQTPEQHDEMVLFWTNYVFEHPEQAGAMSRALATLDQHT